eukprot:6830947-Pyramimonas_sp.AAC.1
MKPVVTSASAYSPGWRCTNQPQLANSAPTQRQISANSAHTARPLTSHATHTSLSLLLNEHYRPPFIRRACRCRVTMCSSHGDGGAPGYTVLCSRHMVLCVRHTVLCMRHTVLCSRHTVLCSRHT